MRGLARYRHVFFFGGDPGLAMLVSTLAHAYVKGLDIVFTKKTQVPPRFTTICWGATLQIPSNSWIFMFVASHPLDSLFNFHIMAFSILFRSFLQMRGCLQMAKESYGTW
jgi:hypothetical protein